MNAGSPRRAELAARLLAVEERLTVACRAAGRERAAVTLVAVSKTWPATDVAALADLGVADFAENRDREAAAKAAQVPQVRWHFVGQLQTNKCRSVAGYASAVHSVDRAKLVEALARAAVEGGRTVAALVQLQLDRDQSAPARGGAGADAVPALAEAIAAAPGLRLAGVMAIAPQGEEPLAAFERLAAVAARLRADHPTADWVSAGMSGDFPAAIAAGATHVRVGTALFGRRPPVLG